MKLQILRADQKPIEGFKQARVDRNSIDLTGTSDNECELILATDVMDSFSGEGAGQILQSLRQKLRLNGQLIVGGTDVRLFSKAVISGTLSMRDASSVVTNCHAMTSVDMTTETLKDLGLFIDSVTLDGLHYEIKATRKNG